MAEQQRSRLVDVDALLQDTVVRNWYESRGEGGRNSAICHPAACLRWRVAKGNSARPSEWVEERTNGTDMTLIKHLKVTKEWVEGTEFEGSDYASSGRTRSI